MARVQTRQTHLKLNNLVIVLEVQQISLKQLDTVESPQERKNHLLQGWNLLEIFKVFPPINRVFLFYSITLQGCRTASCSSFSCNLGQLKLGDKVDIKMTFRLWINTLIKVCLHFQIRRASHYVFSFCFLGRDIIFSQSLCPSRSKSNNRRPNKKFLKIW